MGLPVNAGAERRIRQVFRPSQRPHRSIPKPSPLAWPLKAEWVPRGRRHDMGGFFPGKLRWRPWLGSDRSDGMLLAGRREVAAFEGRDRVVV